MTKNNLHPKKLLLSKWTSRHPQNKEKHFLVIELVEPDEEGAPIEKVVIEAVMTKRQFTIPWKNLRDPIDWYQGWV